MCDGQLRTVNIEGSAWSKATCSTIANQGGTHLMTFCFALGLLGSPLGQQIDRVMRSKWAERTVLTGQYLARSYL